MKCFSPCHRPLNSGIDVTTLRCLDGLGATICILLEFQGHDFWGLFWLLGMALVLIWEALGMSWEWAGSRTDLVTTRVSGDLNFLGPLPDSRNFHFRTA